MIRIRFSKTGYARFISHLDLTRYISRVFRRAEIPVWYTQGFNPRAHMVFSPPLSVGISGLNEVLDIRLDKPMPLEDIKDSLNKNMAQGFAVSDVYETDCQLKNIAFAVYNLYFKLEFAEMINNFIKQPKIEVEKKTKRSSLTIDLKQETIFNGNTEKDCHIVYNIVLPCSNDLNINPFLFTDAIQSFYSIQHQHNEIIPKNMLSYIERVDFLDSKYENFR